MRCPTCHQVFSQFYHKDIYYCNNCGTSLLGDNEINRLTQQEAKMIAGHSKENLSQTTTPLCPKDHTPLTQLQEESIPQFVRILKCSTCASLIVSGKDLVAFKKAQKSKLDFFKTWNIPLPSLHSILVYSMLVAIGVTTLGLFGSLFTPQTPVTQARDIIKQVHISHNNDQTLIYFTSIVSFESRIVFYNRIDNKVLLDVPSSNGSSTNHLARITSVEPSNDIYFTIVLTNSSETITSDPIPFEITK